MLLIQLVAIVAFTFSFYSVVQKEVEPTEAYVFTKDLEVNAKVASEDIQKVTVPSKAITKDFALNPEDIVGKYLSTDVHANQYVYVKQLQGEGEIDPFKSMDLSTYRKISLPVNYVEGFGGDLKRGDRVDLVFVGEAEKRNEKTGDKDKFRYSKVFLQDVLVYSVVTGDGYRYESNYKVTESDSSYREGEKISADSNSSELAVVTIAVKLDEAEQISARLKAGSIKLLGRFNEHQSYETMGYVVGDYEKIYSAPANAETGVSTIGK